MKLDILAFAAHPDDIELSCSATLMKHIAMGKKVGIVDLTQGELGTRGNVESRYAEAAEASTIMGILMPLRTVILITAELRSWWLMRAFYPV